MRWKRGQRSRNLEDRRFQTGRGPRVRRTGLGLGGIAILLLLSVVFGQDFLSLAGTGADLAVPNGDAPLTTGVAPPQEEELVDFVSFVLDDLQTTWRLLFERMGDRYADARLVLFRDAIQSACGFAQSATGPFYCPGDQKVYVDLSFFHELRTRYGAPGDFAQAYVLAHEIGHHVQTLLGIEREVRQAQAARPDSRNQLSVMMELQADCFAGVWGRSTAQRNLLEEGDAEEGLRAAAAIGDDRIQRQSRGYINPESFTHGSSAHRMRWFRRGLSSGQVGECDTFGSATQN